MISTRTLLRLAALGVATAVSSLVVLGAAVGPAAAASVSPSRAYGTPRTLLSGTQDPLAIAVDGSGNVVIASEGGNQIVELSPSGTTVVLPFTGLGLVSWLASDAAGDVFASDPSHNRVVELALGGSQTVVAFTGLSAPGGVGVDEAGDVYVAENATKQVLKLAPGGAQTAITFPGVSGVGAIAVDGAGDVFVLDSTNRRVAEATAGGIRVSLPLSGIDLPSGLAVDSARNVFVSAVNLGVIELPVGGGQRLLGFPGVFGATGVAVDAAGDVYVTDGGQNLVEKLPVGGQATVFPPYAVANPVGVAVDGAGNVFISVDDTTSKQVLELPHGGGPPARVAFSDLGAPGGLAVDGAGDLLVSDLLHNRVLEMTPAGSQLTVGFQGLAFGNLDVGPLAVDLAGDVFVSAGQRVLELTAGGTQKVLPIGGLFDPVAMAVDHQGNVFVADAGLFLDVGYVVTPKLIELPAGKAQVIVSLAAISNVTAMALDHDGNLFVGGVPGSTGPDAVVEVPHLGGLNAVMEVPLTTVPSALAVDDSGDIFATAFALVVELPIDQALLQYPVNGQLNVDTTRPFMWSTIAAAQAYRLIVGTKPYANDLVDSGILPPSHSSFAVPPLPVGPVLYATLYTEEGGTWTRADLVAFTAAPALPATTTTATTPLTIVPGPGLAVTGNNSAAPLTAAAILLTVGLAARAMRHHRSSS